jgi:hypothetical protein
MKQMANDAQFQRSLASSGTCNRALRHVVIGATMLYIIITQSTVAGKFGQPPFRGRVQVAQPGDGHTRGEVSPSFRGRGHNSLGVTA